MLSISSAAALSYAPVVQPTRPAAGRSGVVVAESIADLEAKAVALNPRVGFFDPLGLSSADFWGSGEQATVGFLRHAEIKHGRVAMAAFVGYIVQANGIHFPWALTLDGVSYADISAAGSPPEQFDALPTLAKLQILGAISFLELVGESSAFMEPAGEKHYMMGGKPGYYPSFKNVPVPHPVPFDLFDPFGLSTKMTPERKEKALLAEINNGRLAMFGIMGFVAESKVPGAVPALKGVIAPYAGEPMAYFSSSDSLLPFVSDMLSFSGYFTLVK